MAIFETASNRALLEEGAQLFPKFDAQGLIPVVTQDAASGTILMLAYMNEEALRLTVETGELYYWSRSRQSLWRKGETSGNTQKLIELLIDCDQDSLVARVEQTGTCCHVGYPNCFYRTVAVGTGDPAADTALAMKP